MRCVISAAVLCVSSAALVGCVQDAAQEPAQSMEASCASAVVPEYAHPVAAPAEAPGAGPAGGAPPTLCGWVCDTDYVSEDGETCVHSRLVDCAAGGEPLHSDPVVEPVEITWSSAAEAWSAPATCAWVCDPGFTEDEAGETCIDRKMVPCRTDEAPEYAHPLPAQVQITWSDETGWSQPVACPWECDTGYTTVDGETCVTKRLVACDASDVPPHAHATADEVAVGWTPGSGWEEEPACPWECDPDYVSEDTATCVDAKLTPCGTDAVPQHAHAIPAEVTVTWTDADGWTAPAACAWACDPAFTDDGGGEACFDSKLVPCDPSGLPAHSVSDGGQVEIAWSDTAGWSPAAWCTWTCEADYVSEDGLTCTDHKLAPCVPADVPAHAHALPDDVTITWSDADGWSAPGACAWACDADFAPDEAGAACVDSKWVPCDDSDLPANASSAGGEVEVTWSDATGWSPAAACGWSCVADHVTEDGETCIDTKSVSCDTATIPEGGVALGVMVEITWTDAAGWSAPPPCDFACGEGWVNTIDGACAPGGVLALSAAWANEGGDKVVQHDLRAAGGADVTSDAWDGTTIRLRGARNEVVSFNLVLEAAEVDVDAVLVRFDELEGPGGYSISSTPAPPGDGDLIFDWIARPIELFYVRYLQLEGLSILTWGNYDERHIPIRMRRPWSGPGYGEGTWYDRPDHDTFYPDIAVPLELHTPFDIPVGQNQSVWADVYIPTDAPPGTYTGTVEIIEGVATSRLLPVELTVWDFGLPDKPSTKAFIAASATDIYKRYLGKVWLGSPEEHDRADLIVDRHFQIAHRHRLDIIGADDDPAVMAPSWFDRLDGSLYTAARGYAGPGAGVGASVYCIGLYGGWTLAWDPDDVGSVQSMSESWIHWFEQNAPGVFPFVYLIDEPQPASYPDVEKWAQWIDATPGPGAKLQGLSTVSYHTAQAAMPTLDMPCMGATFAGPTPEIIAAYESILADPDRSVCAYNGMRPGTGSFAMDDDGVALRATAWTQFKKAVDLWFYWQSTYYLDFQSGEGETDVFHSARTFGQDAYFDDVVGRTGWNYTNGDGVLFYPGTDHVYPDSSYDVDGPFASLRLKHWRRGLQDTEYLALAQAVDPAATAAIVASIIPEVLWEVGVETLVDPNWVLTDISWPTDPDVWEQARQELAQIITGQ